MASRILIGCSNCISGDKLVVMNYPGDVRERVRCFNEDQAVWQSFQNRRALRRLRRSADPVAEDILDQVDWTAAERECREGRAIGFHVQ
jgi:hypothetical protein